MPTLADLRTNAKLLRDFTAIKRADFPGDTSDVREAAETMALAEEYAAGLLEWAAQEIEVLVRDRERIDKLEAAIAAGCVLSMQTADEAVGIVELWGMGHPVEGESLRAAIDCAEAQRGETNP